jgi:hypothetical protein
MNRDAKRKHRFGRDRKHRGTGREHLENVPKNGMSTSGVGSE